MRKTVSIFLFLLGFLVCRSDQIFAAVYFSDDFVNFDTIKWEYLHDGNGSFSIENEEAKFTVKYYFDFLLSAPIAIDNWSTIDINGQWRVTSAITPEYLIRISDADNESNWLQVTYQSWGGPFLWFRDSAKPSPFTTDKFFRTPPGVMTDFSIRITDTGWIFTEGSDSWSYASTTLANANNFRVKIGGWDASSLSNQIVYFDNISVSTPDGALVPEPGTMSLFLLAFGPLSWVFRKRRLM